MTTTASRLVDLRHRDLARLHADGVAPDPSVLRGVLDGRVLSGALDQPLLRPLRLWRGKVFAPPAAAGSPITGRNRLGVGPLEIRRYTFEARPTRSHFDDRDVVVLDHDNDANPTSVRRFHDELVQIDEGLFLATSHHRASLDPDADLRFLCHFALVLTNPPG